MTDSLELYSIQFWWMVALAVLVLNSLTAPRLRVWAQAAINLLVIVFLTKKNVGLVLIGLVSTWLGLKLIAKGGLVAKLTLLFMGLIDLALFVFHKLYVHEKPTGLEAVLLLTGFSYVALRLVEVARAVADKRHAPPGIAALVNYLLPFHMLLAGPIQSYDDFVAQPAVPPPLGIAGSLAAFERIAAGLFKKYVLTYLIEAMFLTQFHAQGWYTVLEVHLNFLWLYLDFSAYSDVALGVGQLMGVATPVNFNRPLLARNMIVFWERWHITLSLFIRRHVFTPIQLFLVRRTDGKRPLTAASIAFAVSFLLCGLWHGIGPRWLLWGGCHAVGLIVVNLYRDRLLKRLGRKGLNAYMERFWPRVIATFLTFELSAWSFAIVSFPFEELPLWPTYPH